MSYYDPVTGLGIGFGISSFSGDGLYGCYPDSFGRLGSTPAATSSYSASPRLIFAGVERGDGPSGLRSFKGNGASLRPSSIT